VLFRSNALNEVEGDIEAAVDWLRKKGLAKAAKKAGRTAAEGLVALAADGGQAAGAPAKIYNVGNNHPEELTHVVAVLERELGRTAVREMLPMQPGDVTETFADVTELMRDTGFRPQTSIEDGLRTFVTWYRDYHRI